MGKCWLIVASHQTQPLHYFDDGAQSDGFFGRSMHMRETGTSIKQYAREHGGLGEGGGRLNYRVGCGEVLQGALNGFTFDSAAYLQECIIENVLACGFASRCIPNNRIAACIPTQ